MSGDVYEVTNPDLICKKSVDTNGRVYLGKKFSDEDVKLVVTRIPDDDETEPNASE